MALEAFYADISPQPHHLPLIATAGMLFLEPNDITESNLNNHSYQDLS